MRRLHLALQLLPVLAALLVICGIVVVTLLLVWRPLMFASVDAQVAEARGVPTVVLSIVFMLLLGLAVAVSVQIVGSLLVLSVLVTPAAAALRISASPVIVPLLSTLFAVGSLVGGILLARPYRIAPEVEVVLPDLAASPFVAASTAPAVRALAGR